MTATTHRFLSTLTQQSKPKKSFAIDIFLPLRQWLDRIEIRDRQFAETICHLIPASCPFERDVKAFGYTYHIPPLCKINPLFEELVNLRFRALIYLSELPS
ncbi:Mo-dependent nitrogenase C-terminal domain-containing protein [Pseudanabaena yagii]|uniref:Nitrogenase n=1 Tax=Pseudanabaena yagii GIHE-NHR1 TaxID=2722753 RepID=A0ABX1LVQ7_9CYAN|nr:Mo-dependent nitrogenase C-terminal domain-containing protein [Pseudanabaena yagii]NMF60258.1 nitrogenase [Pseudanabaena yagii GIHE-NHR1]